MSTSTDLQDVRSDANPESQQQQPQQQHLLELINAAHDEIRRLDARIQQMEREVANLAGQIKIGRR